MNKYTKGITKHHRKYSIALIINALFCFNLGAANYHYTVDFEDSLTSADINICFDGKQENYLEIDRFIAYKTLVEEPLVNGVNIEIQGRFWKIKGINKNSCLHYKVSFENNLLKSDLTKHRFSKSIQNKKIIHLEENNWLWLPENRDSSDTIEIEFMLPKNIKISTPWHSVGSWEESGKHRYLLGNEPQEWGYHLIIGDIDVSTIKMKKNRILNVATINATANTGNNVASTTQTINRWLGNIASSVESYLGQFPLKQMQIIVYPQPGIKSGPVPWGEISRGNGLGILFVIRPEHEIKGFYEDWTASHEFAHTMLPKLRYSDIWLSEGLASYLQYVLMAQNNQLSIEQAWIRIYKGLHKGLKGTLSTDREKLLDVSGNRKRGSRSGRTMRIYWSGAAYFLKADIQLREESKGLVGLNDVLLKLSNCCLKGKKVWSGGALASQLDKLSATSIFSVLYKNMAYSSDFPEFNQEFEMLGFQVTQDSTNLGIFNEKPLSKSIMPIN